MKKQKITYGVNGMIEFQAVLKVGKSNLKVQFSDGSFNASSKKPATYTTDNLMIQRAIENSAEFKRGLIHKVSTVELNEEVKVLRNERKSVNETPESTEVTDEATDEVANEPAGETQESANDETGTDDKEPAIELKKVEVHCNDDAKDYLAENFGVVKSKLLNRATIVSVAASNGVEFVFV